MNSHTREPRQDSAHRIRSSRQRQARERAPVGHRCERGEAIDVGLEERVTTVAIDESGVVEQLALIGNGENDDIGCRLRLGGFTQRQGDRSMGDLSGLQAGSQVTTDKDVHLFDRLSGSALMTGHALNL